MSTADDSTTRRKELHYERKDLPLLPAPVRLLVQ